MIRFSLRMLRMGKHKPPLTILDTFLQLAHTKPSKPFILYHDQCFTYGQVDPTSNRAVQALQVHAPLAAGDCVAFFLPNGPPYIWFCLGLAKLGCATACLNFNIRGKSLLHCFTCSGAKVLIADPELKGAVEEVLPSLLKDNVIIFYLSDKSVTAGVESLSDKIKAASDEPISKSLRSGVNQKTLAVSIYTSGTIGLPKAAVINHFRLLLGCGLFHSAGVTSDDVINTRLPLHHSAGFMVGVNGCINKGATIVLRQKFSARQFWDDYRKYNMTVIQYIGELLRYLCNVPRKDNDREHCVKIAVGNRLRADVWKEFLN